MHKNTTKRHTEIEEIARARRGFMYLMLAFTLFVIVLELFW
jgi:hypothetical protein